MKRWEPWTEAQDEVLREFGNRNCGRKARKFDKEGFCPTCHQRGLTEKQKHQNTVLLKEIKLSESGEEFNRAKREYDKARQQNHRIRERLNSRRE